MDIDLWDFGEPIGRVEGTLLNGPEVRVDRDPGNPMGPEAYPYPHGVGSLLQLFKG